MSSGLIALLDDVAGIAKLAAASLDDVAGAAGKASSKAAGVVIDDAAVTPRYAVGLPPQRELPMIGQIALGSIRNKLIFLLPAALALSAFAPWAVTPLLMAGGAFLCFEAAEKLAAPLLGHGAHEDEPAQAGSPEQLEQEKITGAIRTDLILSGEIMAIALASVADRPLIEQALALAVVALLITAGVYGVVALIVKMDDIGLHLAKRKMPVSQLTGRALVRAMPVLLGALGGIGTAAMLWVGGGIMLHGLDQFGLGALPGWLHHLGAVAGEAVPVIAGIVEWAVGAIGSGLFGLVVGVLIATAIHLFKRR